MIDELNDEEKDKLVDYGLKWSQIGLSTEEVDVTAAMEAIVKAYIFSGIKPPTAMLGPFDNPVECAKAQIMVKRLPDDTDFEKLTNIEIPEGTEFQSEELYEAISEQMYGFQDASWLCLFDYMREVLDLQELESFKGLIEVAKNVGWWAAYDKVAFFQHRPLEIHFNEQGKLHNSDGPAIKWRGEDRSYDIYAIDGEIQLPPA
jgi:hypothetical protein